MSPESEAEVPKHLSPNVASQSSDSDENRRREGVV